MTWSGKTVTGSVMLLGDVVSVVSCYMCGWDDRDSTDSLCSRDEHQLLTVSSPASLGLDSCSCSQIPHPPPLVSLEFFGSATRQSQSGEEQNREQLQSRKQ